MPSKSVKYLRLQSGDALPSIDELRPFKAIVVIDGEMPEIWQWEVSRWLVQSGCACMMAWGLDCSAWNESVEDANLEAFNYEDIPEDRVVMTTSHDDEELSEVFWYSKHRARHPVHEIRNVVILHVSSEDKKLELESMYEDA
jgi:hypothetical protein